MRSLTRTILWITRLALGGVFAILGITGLVVPVMPGWIFIALAVLLLAEDVPPFKRLVHRIECRWPQARGAIGKARRWLGQDPRPDPPCAAADDPPHAAGKQRG